jgi:hypothetical protein
MKHKVRPADSHVFYYLLKTSWLMQFSFIILTQFDEYHRNNIVVKLTMLISKVIYHLN